MIYLLQCPEGYGPIYSGLAEEVVIAMLEEDSNDSYTASSNWKDTLDYAMIRKFNDVDEFNELADKLEITKKESEKITKSLLYKDDYFYLIKIDNDDDILAKMLNEWHEYTINNTSVIECAIEIIRKNEKSMLNSWYDIYFDSRPGYPDKDIDPEDVEKKITYWKKEKIKSVICLLSDEELDYYKDFDGGLIGQYEKIGLNVVHIPIEDHKSPPLNDEELKQIKHSFDALEEPVLIHCSAGVDRTGCAIKHLTKIISDNENNPQ